MTPGHAHRGPDRSGWCHVICDACWFARCILSDTPGRRPIRALPADAMVCCYCGATTWSGIFVRADPQQTPCRGQAAGPTVGAT